MIGLKFNSRALINTKLVCIDCIKNISRKVPEWISGQQWVQIKARASMQGYHKMTSNGLRRPASSDSSNTIHKMWEILDQSFPLSLWHHFLSRGHLLILRREEGGQPLFWEVLELVAGPNRESFKTSEVLTPFVIQGFQIFTSPNGKSGREQPLIWKWLRLFFFIYSYFYLSKKRKCLQVRPHPTLHKFAATCDLKVEIE